LNFLTCVLRVVDGEGSRVGQGPVVLLRD
jgi:hypothetical protein